MAMIGFVMIAASGFANVINTTSGVKELVDALSTGFQVHFARMTPTF